MCENEKSIPLSVPNFAGNELAYTSEAVKAGWVSTGGGYVREFERVTAAYTGAPDAAACQSGTAGLHLSLLLMGVTHEDAVIVPALTFIAAVNPVSYLGAMPIFMDCDESLCLDAEKLAAYCETQCALSGGRLLHKATGRHVKAMVVVHVFGNLANMEALMQVAARYHIRVVEDATEALGTRCAIGAYRGLHAGVIGDIGALSYNGNKIVTTGGGGMVLSKDAALVAHARHLSTQAKADELHYSHDEIGYNYRMTNVQAALGVAQMELLASFLQVKRQNYERYCAGVAAIPGLRMLRAQEESNHWFYALYVEDGYPLDRDALIALFGRHNIQTRPIWGLICDQTPYKGAEAYKMERARQYQAHVVNLPCSTNLTAEDVERVLAVLREGSV